MTKIFKLISLLYLIINSMSIAIADENFFNKGLKLFQDKKYEDARSVSYTHLTLPTKLTV